MKFCLLILAIFLLNNITFAGVTPLKGSYQCIDGNNDSICPQFIKPIFYNNKLVEIKVIYNGDCAGQGPYSFWCEETICEGLSQKFIFIDEQHYQWENRQHDVLNRCLFEKI